MTRHTRVFLTLQWTQPLFHPGRPPVWAGEHEHHQEPDTQPPQHSAWSPPPNTSHQHLRERETHTSVHLCEGGRKEARKGDGERCQQISGIDEKHLQWKALRRALTFKRTCRGVFPVSWFTSYAAFCIFKGHIGPHLSHCLPLKRKKLLRNTDHRHFSVLKGVKKGFVTTRECPPPPLALFLPSELHHSLLVSVITVPLVALHIIYLLAAINCCRACVETWRDVPSAELVPWGVDVGERWKENKYARESGSR